MCIVVLMFGCISCKFVSEGNFVKGGDSDVIVLMMIVLQDLIDIYFDVDEESYLCYMCEVWISGGNVLLWQVVIVLLGDVWLLLMGMMDFVDNCFDDLIGMLCQCVCVVNLDWCLSFGQFGCVYLLSCVVYYVLFVFDVVVVIDVMCCVLYFVDVNGIVVICLVMFGCLYDNLCEIDVGLKVGDIVIVDGFQCVQVGDKVKVVLCVIEVVMVVYVVSGMMGSV